MIDLKFYIQVGTGTPILLEFAPDGWNEQLIQYERKMEYMGVFTSFSIPLKFVRDGAGILRNEFYTVGISSETYLQVWKRDKITNAFSQKYTGKFDFTTVIDEQDTITITLVTSGLAAEIERKAEVTYNIEMPHLETGSDWAEILNYQGVSNYYEKTHQGSPSIVSSATYTLNSTSPNFSIETHMGRYTFFDLQGAISLHNEGVGINGYHNIKVIRACQLEISTFITDTFLQFANVTVSGTSCTFKIYHKLVLYRGVTTTYLASSSPVTLTVLSGGYSLHLPYSLMLTNTVIDALPGDEFGIVLYVEYTSGDPVMFDMSYVYGEEWIYQEINIYATLKEIAFPIASDKYILGQFGIFFGDYPVKSDLLDLSNLKYFCPNTWADWENNFLHRNSVIKTTFKDFFKHHNSIRPIGVGVEYISGVETLVMEELEYFLNKNESYITIDNASNFKLEVAKELIPGTIKIGFNEQVYGDDFGKFEYMNTHALLCPQTFLKNEADWVSPYRMDINGFDYSIKKKLDIEHSGQSNTDWQYADDIFSYDCEYTGISMIGTKYYKILRTNNLVVTDPNYPEPTEAFNLYYTPKRNLLNHGNFIRSALKSFDALSLTHTSQGLYTHLITQLTGDPQLYEETDVVISTLGDVFFMPFYITFTAPFTDAAENLYNANNKLMIRFLWQGNYYKGYVMSMSKKFSGLKETEFKILLSDDNDLTNLI